MRRVTPLGGTQPPADLDHALGPKHYLCLVRSQRRSSISHLRDLPITGLKLDRSFTAGVTDRQSRNAILAGGLAGLAAGLGLDTVAEEVETRQQAQLLSDQGWEMGQGLLFGAAVALSTLELR